MTLIVMLSGAFGMRTALNSLVEEAGSKVTFPAHAIPCRTEQSHMHNGHAHCQTSRCGVL